MVTEYRAWDTRNMVCASKWESSEKTAYKQAGIPPQFVEIETRQISDAAAREHFPTHHN